MKLSDLPNLYSEQYRVRFLAFAAALMACALALAAKTTACTLPAALLLILWLKEIPIGWRRVAQVVPFAVLGVGMGLVTVWWERYHQGTRGAASSARDGQHQLQARVVNLAHYLLDGAVRVYMLVGSHHDENSVRVWERS